MQTPLRIARFADREIWTLDDPATRNALSEAMVDALQQACLRAAADASLRFVVLTGAGPAFCAGGSLGSFATLVGKPLAPDHTDPVIASNRQFGRLLQALARLPQVLLAQVNGAAMGGGFGLVCCADMVIADERAQFATPEVTLGVVPAQIAPFVLRRLGDRAARQCMLTGRRWTAHEMQALGLVDLVVPAAEMAAAVDLQLARFEAAAPGAVAATKRLLWQAGIGKSVEALLDAGAVEFAAGLRSTEAAEGLQAFTHKRKPGWAP